MKKLLLFMFCLFFMMNSLLCEEVDLKLHAKSAILVETSTHKVLYEKEANTKRSPASMTKIMTLLLTMEALNNGKIKLDDKVLISKKAASMGGTQIFVEEGSSVDVKTLIKGMAIASANDAAVAIAEYIGGTESNFVYMMNKRAKELGCKNTSFKNPHGLDEDDHYTTAYDLSKIAIELLKYPSILKYTSTYEDYIDVSGSNHWLVNTNKLVRFYNGIDGLKTGYTSKALYCLTATMEKNNMRLVSIVMGEENKDNRSEDTISLMEYGFSTYGVKNIYSKDNYKKTIYIDNASNRKVNYYLKDNVNIVVNKDNRDVKYSTEEKLYNVKAPLMKDSVIGELILNYNNSTYKYDLIVKEDIKKANYARVFINLLKDVFSGSRVRN